MSLFNIAFGGPQVMFSQTLLLLPYLQQGTTLPASFDICVSVGPTPWYRQAQPVPYDTERHNCSNDEKQPAYYYASTRAFSRYLSSVSLPPCRDAAFVFTAFIRFSSANLPASMMSTPPKLLCMLCSPPSPSG